MLRVLVLAAFLWPMLQQPAAAQETAGGGTYLIFGATTGKTNNPRARPAYMADLGLEFGMQMGLGYAYRGFRLEGQVGYEAFFLNNVLPGSGTVLSDTDIYGKATGPVAMANLFFRPGGAGTFQPFVGAGIGVASLTTDFRGDFCSVPLATCFTNTKLVGGKETVGAWQWAIGMSKLATDGNSELVIGYRYFTTRDIDVDVAGYGTVLQDGVESHSLMLSWRWYFGALGR